MFDGDQLESLNAILGDVYTISPRRERLTPVFVGFYVVFRNQNSGFTSHLVSLLGAIYATYMPQNNPVICLDNFLRIHIKSTMTGKFYSVICRRTDWCCHGYFGGRLVAEHDREGSRPPPFRGERGWGVTDVKPAGGHTPC